MKALFPSPASAALAIALLSSLLPSAHSAEIPPYPYETPAWKAALRKKLEAPCTFEFRKTPVREAVEKVCATAGMSLEVEAGARQAANQPIEMSFQKTAANHALSLLAENAGLNVLLTRKGVVLTDRSVFSDPTTKAESIGRFVEWVRSRRFPTPEERAEQERRQAETRKEEKARKDSLEKARKALRSTKIGDDFVDAYAGEVIQALSKAAGVEITLTHRACEKLPPRARITVRGGARPLDKVLDEIAAAHGLEYAVDHRGIFLHAGDFHPQAYRTLEDAEKAALRRKEEERRILDRKLSTDLKGARVCDWVEALSRDVEMQVLPDAPSWGARVRLPERTAGLSVGKLAEALKRQGIALVFDGFMDEERSAEGFAVYLLKTKK